MNANYRKAPEVETIGRKLIRSHHQHLISHQVRVEFYFSVKTPKKNGKEVWGTARKISSLAAFLAGKDSDDLDAGDDFFVVVISAPIWRYLSDEKRIALVDHELMHLWAYPEEKTNKIKLSLEPHDFEGFNEEIRRYGMWRHDAQALFDAMKEAEEATNAQGILEFEGDEAQSDKSQAPKSDEKPVEAAAENNEQVTAQVTEQPEVKTEEKPEKPKTRRGKVTSRSIVVQAH